MIDSCIANKCREIPRYTDPRGGRIDRDRAQFNLRIPRRSAETTRFAETRRAVVDPRAAGSFAGPNDHPVARQTTKSIQPCWRRAPWKIAVGRSIRTRYTQFFFYTCTRACSATAFVCLCVYEWFALFAFAFLAGGRGEGKGVQGYHPAVPIPAYHIYVRVPVQTQTKRMHTMHCAHASTDRRDGTLQLRHARCYTGCSARNADDGRFHIGCNCPAVVPACVWSTI